MRENGRMSVARAGGEGGDLFSPIAPASARAILNRLSFWDVVINHA
jgi:hypothetical protein